MSIITRFFRYYWQADTQYTIHSPFVFRFIQDVLEDDRDFYCFAPLQRLSENLKNLNQEIEVNDLGAGSRKLKGKKRMLSAIAKTSMSSTKKGQLLFRLVHFLGAKNRLELGTSLGLGTLYQYFPNTQFPLYTLEGCPNILAEAKKNFKLLKAENIIPIEGNFEDTLLPTLQKMKRLDYAFIDGNHRLEPTLRYFEACLAYSHENTVLVFDDIHWSKEMEEAWDLIRKDPRVKLSLDLFQIGLVFFRKEGYEKQDFKLISWKYKPYRMGFFM